MARLLKTLSTGAYACDPDGLITGYNAHAAAVWGREPRLYDPAERFCGSFRLFTSDGVPLPHEECWMALALRDRRAYEAREVVVGRPDGERRELLSYASPVLDGDGRLLGAVNVLVDLTERKRAERQARQRERELEDLFENAAVGLHWLGPDGTIVRANAAALATLGYARDEHEGHPLAEFSVEPDAIDSLRKRLAAGETLRDVETRMRAKDGSIRYLRLSANVLWEDGRFVHARCFSHDISAQKRAEEALHEANRRKSEFLAVLGHELRNPLGPVRSAVDYLRTAAPPRTDLEEAHEVIDRQVCQLTRLVDDLLDLARITYGKLELRRERVPLARVVESALDAARPLVDARRHTLSIELPPEPVSLDADPARLAQVFANLLSNAARYTDPGGHVALAASVEGDEVVVRVRDDGRGIPAAQLPRVFEAFTQLGSGAERRGEGLGLGLNLVKSLVELHGGSVSAHSAGPGRGSEFSARLPAVRGGAKAAAPAVRTPVASAPCRILIVDDNHDAARSLEMVLARLGHEVRTAFDSRDAQRIAADFAPEVVLLDIGLPDVDGYETCRLLRQQPWVRRARFLAITGWGQLDDKRRARAAGFDAHLTKPVELGVLQEHLARHCDD